MPYHAHKIGDVLGLTDDQARQDQDLVDHTTDPAGHPPFAGVGTTGFVPDPTDLQGQFLRDDGTWADGTVVEYAAVATNGVGGGTIEGDFNAMDWTGHPYAVGENLNILLNHVVTCAHGTATAYRWLGPKDVTIGPSGNYTAVNADFGPQGTNDHDALINVDPDDHHAQVHAHDGLDGSGQVVHLNIQSRNHADAHDMASITNLLADQQRQDDALAAHEAADDPHPQYLREAPVYILYGGASNFTFNTTPSKLINYPNSTILHTPGTGTSPTTGDIVIEEDGLYKITGFLTGTQGNDTKEEQMGLFLDVDGNREIFSAFDVATDKTDGRTFSASVMRSATAGMVVSLWCEATSGMGTFSVINTSLEIVKIPGT